jgi:RNA polymerase sigma-70 factor (ECF subfamily)
MGALLMTEAAAREDGTLVSEVLAGNQLSFQLLVERYQARVFQVARHYVRDAAEVEDIAQETFLKAYRSLGSFQQQSAFSTWLARIAINTALDTLKRRGRSPVRTVEDPEATPARPGRAVSAPDAGMRSEEVARVTRAVLEELPEIFRTVLVLREFDGLSYQEMADVIGISIGTVESRLFRARARFKARLLEKHPEFAEEEL